MEVIVAKSAGFCFGVKRAIDCVYDEIEKSHGENIYTFGPIIHNEQVVSDLEKKGVKVIESENELSKLTSGIVIIRSHGVSRHIYEIINKNVRIVDATCPFVAKIHNIVDKESKNGRKIVIIGNEGHPEVEGIKGWSNTETTVIGSEEDAEKYLVPKNDSICIVSQTTFNNIKFNKLVEIISNMRYNSIVVNTICNATNERQIEAKEIAGRVDSMIVVGGSNSSNTQKLYEICKNECLNTYYIQTADELKDVSLQDSKVVGITAGASTPNNIIEEVRTNVRIKF